MYQLIICTLHTALPEKPGVKLTLTFIRNTQSKPFCLRVCVCFMQMEHDSTSRGGERKITDLILLRVKLQP